MAKYDKGDLVRLSAAFTVEGVATDPTTVTLKIHDPSGNAVTYTYALGQVTRDSVGNYHFDLAVDETGIWPYHWSGTGTVVTAGEAFLYVRRSRL
jgi:hypothetical protein